MRTWIVRVTAVEAYRGDPADPLYWHFKVAALSAKDAVATTRRADAVADDMTVEAFADGRV